MISGFLKAVDRISTNRVVSDDDFSDRLNHVVSMCIFLGFASAASLKQYVGDPLKCWMPAEFAKSMRQYTDNYCFINSMYRVPWDQPIAWDAERRFDLDISFYRWVPVIFLCMAFLFKIPNLFWELIKTYSGFNVQKIVNMADEATLIGEEEREKIINNMGYFMDRWLRSYRGYHHGRFAKAKRSLSGVFFWALGRRTGTFTTGLYLTTKILYAINAIGMFFLLSAFLQFDFASYGFTVLGNLNKNGEFKDLENFPRVVFCDLDVRQLQNVQRFTVQCVLSINLFTEKMFAITWFWLVFVAVTSIYSLIRWFIFILLRSHREGFLQNYLGLMELKKGSGERELFKIFVIEYLRDDGVFMLRSISNNTNPMITLDLVEELWRRFKLTHQPDDDEQM